MIQKALKYILPSWLYYRYYPQRTAKEELLIRCKKEGIPVVKYNSKFKGNSTYKPGRRFTKAPKIIK